ncbi:hypothetical protein FPCIR_9949 [Fusarium pseudocircinatum]|uniref:Protein kinase domain-containing protein n=1 Tax=Fusarium pseudocircinatum TaxID=56676 RepID=A0A8H5L0C4_9HYPO|nr:hypothetical protein FPCIR_9949 [Fusarium pseudocircinatum]
MARSYHNKPSLERTYRTATGRRTAPLTDPQGLRLRFPLDIGGTSVFSRDANSIIFIPHCRFWTDSSKDNDPDAWCRQDAWTGLPILQKLTYGSFWNFLGNYESQIYATQEDFAPPTIRLKSEFRPLAYQWSLQLLSALSLIHSHGIAYGEIYEENCWITAGSVSISLAGFVGSEFRDPSTGYNLPGWFFTDTDFAPDKLPLDRAVGVPTLKTDMFYFGGLVYEFMTSHVPGLESFREIRRVVAEGWMPDLEDEFMGKVIHKCWKFEYEDIEELQSHVQAFVEAQGRTNKGDELEGFDAYSIYRELEANFVPTEGE